MTTPIKDPVISVDRQARSYACFDDITILRKFRGYVNETDAITEAEFWFRGRTDIKPRLVFPNIKRMTIS